MVEAIDLVGTKVTNPTLSLPEGKEGAENLEPLMTSIREALKFRYGDEVSQEVAGKPFMLLTFSEATRQTYGINAVIFVGEEAATLRVQHCVDQSTGGRYSLLLKDFSRPDRSILLTLRDKLYKGINSNFAFGLNIEYIIERVSHSWGIYFVTEYKGERTITDRSMVAAIIPTHNLQTELFHRTFRDKKIKMPADFLWIDNQFPQAPKKPVTPAA